MSDLEMPAMTTLVLVRHGETIWNRDGRVQGALDSPLSALGAAQAAAVATALADEGLTRIWCSDLGRTRATVAALATRTRIEVVYDHRLRERCYGELEGWTYQEIRERFPKQFERLDSRDPTFEPAGGESAITFRDRVVAVMHDIVAQSEGERVAVVTHGGVVGIMYRHVREIPLDARRDYPLLNASINRFRCVQGLWQLITWGDVSHLDGLAPPDDHGAGPAVHR